VPIYWVVLLSRVLCCAWIDPIVVHFRTGKPASKLWLKNRIESNSRLSDFMSEPDHSRSDSSFTFQEF